MRAFMRYIFRKLFRVLFRVQIKGYLTKPESNRLMIIANHESFLDGVILGLYLPYDPVFVVHTSVLRNRFFRTVLKLVDYLAVDPAKPMAVKTVLKLIEQGRPVVIFPEGRITVTGSLMKVYDGPAFVAAKTGATILPVRLDGPARSYFSRTPGNYPRRLFPKVTISVQKPTSIAMPEAESAKVRRRKVGEAMRRIMQQMLFESQPKQALYNSLLSAISTYGRRRRIAEDVKQIEYTYNDLLKMTLALGRMATKHSKPDERVGILMPNLVTTVCMIIGSGALRRIPAMLNYKAGAGGMQDACIAANIKTIFTSRAFIEQAKLESDVAAIKGVKIFYLEDLKQQMNLLDKLWVLKNMLLPRSIGISMDPENPAVVLFTSGSEGKPKGVVLSHRALLSNIAQIRSVIEFSIDDKLLNALPIFHSFGLTGGALLPIMTGVNLFLYPSPLHYRVIPEIAYDRNCSIMFGTSTFLANYAKFAHPYDFYRLRYVVAGAEKLSDAVRNIWFEKFGIRILEGYGATETAPVLAVNTPMAFRSNTVGQLLPGIEYRLLPVPGIEGGGMLHVRGSNVMSGYYRFNTPGMLEPPVSAVGDGWYETGDIVSIDDDGYVSIIGRVKRFAKVAGEMVSLEVVEKIATLIAPTALHGATSRTGGTRGESIILFTTGDSITREALVDSARKSGIPEIAVPRKVVRVNSLPLLATGKVDYVSLKRLAEAA
jgi:acyl-[acyl-carrier-protein]-phospholipid O-acyltransferase / long-chain-fatty-acid--[acyl-carrier-protein] ligase